MYDDEDVRFVSYWPTPEERAARQAEWGAEMDADIRFYGRATWVTLAVLAFVVAPLCWFLERVAPL